jgi:RNA polymerase sigma-B factor
MAAHMSRNRTAAVASGTRCAPLGPHPTTAELNERFDLWRDHGDRRAREQLVRHYLPLATRLARRYRGAWEPAEDLRQVASVGLLKAIDRHDPSRGTSFQAFAVPTILGEIKRYFRDCGWAVHVPRGTQDLALKVEQAQRSLLTRTGRPATIQALAEYLELPLEDVCDAAEAAVSHHSMSLETPYDDGEGDSYTIGDSLGTSDDRYERVEDVMCIAQAASQLTERQRRVLAMRFIDERTQTQIATEIGVSQMQVSRILHAALDRLSAIVEAEAG